MFEIRLARSEECDRIVAIEDEAGRLFASAGLPADLPGMEPAMVELAIAQRRVWVVDEGDIAVGFALVWHRPGAIHLRELDVHPDVMRRGLGRRLVEHVVEQSRRQGVDRVTLTTFRDVPWNAPLYQRWGFVIVEPEQLGPWMVRLREDERFEGFDRWPRCAMVRTVT